MAKFSFSSTVGDILDDAQANELFYELVPEARDYGDMLEMGRGFTIDEAMPFITMIAEGLGIDNLDERVADFKTKLESL